MQIDADGEQRLWVCVIVQAIRDALSTRFPPNSQEALARAEARRWLRGGHEDFDQVCELANIDGEALARWWATIEAEARHNNVREIIADAVAIAAKTRAVLHAAA